MPQNLKTLRKQIREQRRNLPLELQAQASRNIVTQIITLPIFQQSKNIGLYLATEGEIDLELLIKIAWQQKKLCYLPIISPKDKMSLEFIRYNQGDTLIKSNYNILVPILDPEKTLPPSELDLVITPLVAINSQGYRLGRGAGYYDKTFAYKISTPQAKPFLLGVAYEFQRINFIPNKWDVPLQQIITNSCY